MTWPKLMLPLTCLFLTISLALAVDWLAVEWLNFGSPMARGDLLAVSLVSAAAYLAIVVARGRSLAKQALDDLDQLCRTDWRRLATDIPEPGLANADPGCRWAKVVLRLRERMTGLARRADALERDRAALESRARRYEAQTQRIQSILSALGEPVLVIDKRDELVLANSSANALFAIDAAAIERRAVSTLVKCERLVEMLTETRKCKAFTQRRCEIEIPDGQGPSHWYRVTARNIPTQPGQSDPDGTSQGVVAVLHDITAQKTIQKRNADFVSAVSHEMNTPLAGIKAYLELLADGEAHDKQTEEQFLQVIGAETDRLQCLVDDLVELARIEADLAGATKQVQSLDDMLQEAWRSIQAQAADKNLTLQVELSTADLWVLVDRHMIMLAAQHVLSNAVKYTPPGGRVTLRSRAADDEVCFEVEDTGVGLSAEDCRKVFEKFYRVPRQKEMAKGTGLGLPLVKHIIQDVHGGRIEVHSTLDAGTVFRVYLAAAEADHAPTPSPSPAARAIEETIG